LNGVLIGAVTREAAGRIGAGMVLLRILPHGVFELPAYFVAAAYGLWLGQPSKAPAEGEPVGFAARLWHAVTRFALVVLPLLTLAAAVEAFVTRLAVH